jgi:hypothetical protein
MCGTCFTLFFLFKIYSNCNKISLYTFWVFTIFHKLFWSNFGRDFGLTKLSDNTDLLRINKLFPLFLHTRTRLLNKVTKSMVSTFI